MQRWSCFSKSTALWYCPQPTTMVLVWQLTPPYQMGGRSLGYVGCTYTCTQEGKVTIGYTTSIVYPDGRKSFTNSQTHMYTCEYVHACIYVSTHTHMYTCTHTHSGTPHGIGSDKHGWSGKPLRLDGDRSNFKALYVVFCFHGTLHQSPNDHISQD